MDTDIDEYLCTTVFKLHEKNDIFNYTRIF